MKISDLKIKWILFDVEGTTTSIDFVKSVLFPYSLEKLSSFIDQHQNSFDFQQAFKLISDTIDSEMNKKIKVKELSELLGQWIQQDRKHTGLKQIQGMIWEMGYKSGEIKGHVYPEVLDVFQKINENKINIAIYSSGSVLAQKLLFKFSCLGDMSPLIKDYFDTQVGIKSDSRSYEKIITQFKASPADVLFLSDVPLELHAAEKIGLNVLQVVRASDGTLPSQFPFIQSLQELL